MKVCVVDPVSSGKCLIEALEDYGCTIITIATSSLKYDAKRKIDFIYEKSNLEPAVLYLKKEEVSHILAGSEFGVTTTDILSFSLKLKGNDYKLRQSRSCKLSMYERISKCNIEAGRHSVITKKDELEDVLSLFSHPVFIKPLNSAGSDGCFKCNTSDEVVEKVNMILNKKNLLGNINDKILIQEYIEGQQYVVNTVTLESAHVFTDIYLVKIEEVEGIPIYRSIIAVDINYNEGEVGKVIQYTKKCLDALGVNNGAAHTEIRLTEHGPKLIEVNSRLMGPNLDSNAFYFGLGYSQASIWAESIFDPKSFYKRVEKKQTSKKNTLQWFI
ncbi:ATP-grasp domain-containing protein [Endozoicomonas sp. ONNA1]|uniref:ATP-grasp domain-containing protein n=1 Tax=Endozoicomonas sp. ONNA1 TaxID=2828740 RepID=UPI002147C733|nr:ATP-grasp domain-containing protein [Endozoicomonas sp. ONNA1]